MATRSASKTGSPLPARLLSDRLYEVLRDRIVAGEMGDGAPMRQDVIAAELGVSKIPLREALTRLEHDGLVRSYANRGYVVRPMSTEEAEEIFDLRLRIEPAATARGSAKATNEDRDHARLMLEQVTDSNRTAEAVAASNRAFHLALVEPGGRDLTSQLTERLHVLADRYVHVHLKPVGRAARAQREHRDLLEAWCAADAAKVELLVRGHIEATLSDLRRQLAI